MGLHFDPVAQIGTSPDLRADIRRWLAAEPVLALVDAFRGDTGRLTGNASLASALDYLDRFSEQWDTRQGRERNQAGELGLTPEQEATALAAIEALGHHLGTARPRFHHYDHVLMLGGLIRACISRPRYAARLMADGEITADCATALGGHRPFVGDEFDLAAANGLPHLTEEYEALDAGTRRAFQLGEPTSVEGKESELVGGTWGVRRYRTADGLAVNVAAAPSSDPATRRADTPDSYAFFARHLAQLQPGQRLLMITTPIYVPPQHLAAIRMLGLPYDVEVDTVGTVNPDAKSGDSLPYTATKYLLEVRATFRALRWLLKDIEARRGE